MFNSVLSTIDLYCEDEQLITKSPPRPTIAPHKATLHPPLPSVGDVQAALEEKEEGPHHV